MEEILRIYGFNQVPIPTKWNYTLPLQSGLNPERIQEITSEHLVSRGFSELLNNSLTKASYAETYESQSINSKQAVRILNPLSQDLEHMRQSLLFGILESIEHNQNRQHPDLAFFEFGKTYQQSEGNYHEERQLIIAQSGLVQSEHWSVASQASSFIELKRHLNALLTRFGILSKCEEVTLTNELFADGYSLQIGTKKLVDFGWVHHKLQSGFDLKNPVFAAVINWDLFLKQCAKVAIEFQELPKSFAVRRDLSLLIDQQTTYAQLKASAVKAERKLLKSIDLFDVYEGKNLPEGKKSYALCFYLQDQSRTLQEQEIEKAMQRIIDALQSNCGASLRN
jgi:phenylalanyl-tRNA synthetase beta chain